MDDGIAIVSMNYPQELVRLLAKEQSPNVVHHPTLPSQSSLTKFSVVVLNTSAQDVDRVLDNINVLRTERMFLGTIVITSFLSRSWFSTQEDGVLINTKGCIHVQLPFLVEEFNQLIMRCVRLDEEEVSGVRRLLQANKLVKNARYIGHDYDNKFALVLAHLREIEKLSYYNPPQADLVVDVIKILRSSLTREKVQKFRADTTQLLEYADECFANSTSRIMLLADNYWIAFESWFELVEVKHNVLDIDLGEVFAQAKRVQCAIKEILKAISALKDDAQQVVKHAQ